MISPVIGLLHKYGHRIDFEEEGEEISRGLSPAGGQTTVVIQLGSAAAVGTVY